MIVKRMRRLAAGQGTGAAKRLGPVARLGAVLWLTASAPGGIASAQDGIVSAQEGTASAQAATTSAQEGTDAVQAATTSAQDGTAFAQDGLDAVQAEPSVSATTDPAGSARERSSAPSAVPAGPIPADTLDLGTTSITGNQELPKVLYIVPWKRSDLADLVGQPVNTLLDEVLAPIDPEVFERHLDYYGVLHGDSSSARAQALTEED